MYFPYLYARGEEANAIATIAESRIGSSSIIPIIDNSFDGTNLDSSKKMVGKLIENMRKFILFVNDETELDKYEKEHGNIFYDYCILGGKNYFINNNKFKYEAILYEQNVNFVDDSKILYHIFSSENSWLIQPFSNEYGTSKVVVLFDAFKIWEPNINYPNQDLFKNSGICFTYKKMKFAGFGDYTILSKGFSASSGGNAATITHVIHLTKKSKNEDNSDCIVTRHFLTSREEEEDISTRSNKTLKKVVEHKSEFLNSKGLQEIENILNTRGSTSLGMYKRIGIIHHLELMDWIMKNM